MSNEAYVTNFNSFGGNKLFKVHGFSGDIIELDNGIRTKKICGLKEFQNGNFHIYEKESGREIKDSQIPWR